MKVPTAHDGRGRPCRRDGERARQACTPIADASHRPVHVGALRDSASNRFYLRHGFHLVSQDEFDNHYLRAAASQG